MEAVTRRRLTAIAVLTVLFGASIGVMFALWADFVPGFFFTALGVFVLGVALVFIFVRSRIEVGGLSGANRTTDIPSTPPSPPPMLDAPLVIEPSPSRPELLGRPAEATSAATAPAGYTFRGYTLYMRGSEAKPIRFFSDKKDEVGKPIALPSGFEAVWDRKKDKPVLRAIKEAPVEEAAEEEVAPRVAGGDGRRCSAWTSIGIMCEKLAAEDSPYCGTHANYKPEQVTGQFEVNVPRGTAGKAFKGGSGATEVRVGGKPTTLKPLKLKAPEFEAHVARPEVKGSRRPFRLPEFQVRQDRRPIKAFKGVRPAEFQLREPRPAAPSGKRVKPGDFELHEGGSAKPLRLKEPNLVVRGPATPVVKPLRLKEPTLNVRPVGTLGAKPLRVREANLNVRPAPVMAPKPLKIREANLNVRSGAAPPPKPLRLREPNLNVRSGAAPASKPLRVREPNLNVRAAAAHAPRPLRVRETEPNLRPSTVHKAKPLRIGEPNVEVRRGVGRPGKPLKPWEPELVIKESRPKAAKPLRNPSDGNLVVREPGHLSGAKPLRPQEPKLEVRSGSDRKPAKPFRTNPSDILVERDNRTRSDVGLSTTKPKTRRNK